MHVMNGAPEHAPKKSGTQSIDEISRPREELMTVKREQWAQARETLHEVFGQESIPKDIVADLLDVRQAIASGVTNAQYLNGLVPGSESQIESLVQKIAQYHVLDSKDTSPSEEEIGALRESLRAYFDSYRIARNAAHFQSTVRDIESEISSDHAARRSNFYSEKERVEELVERLEDRYVDTDFTSADFKELVATCNLPKLDSLELQDIGVLAKIKDVYGRFMEGDRTQYVTLSAGLMVPAFIDGYAPSFFVEAFKGDRVDLTQLAIYALMEIGATGAAVYLNKQFQEFLVKNFSKEGGIGEHIATNVAELPAEQIGTFGMDTVKSRIARAKNSYEGVYSTISFEVLPALVMLVTSAAVLFEQSPILAGSTVAGTGFVMALDRWLEKKTGWWNKERKAQKQTEHLAKKMNEQLNAHMEIILSGMKDELADRTETMLAQERAAHSDLSFADTIRDKASQFGSTINLLISGVAASLSGGSVSNFVSALIYSGNFRMGVERLLHARRGLLNDFRNMQEMELLFNGYAAEEAEKEKDRVSIHDVHSSEIAISDVEVSVGDKNILDVRQLDIPAGALVHLAGASGAGKTTLMKVISGYYKPTKGNISLGGVNIDSIKKSGEDSVYSAINYLPQFPYILEDTLRANVLFGLKKPVSDSDIRAVLSEVGLDERFKNLDESLLGGRGDMGTTSGGETSRIGLARILLKIRNTDSKVVFLDEPTASVDAKTKDDIARLIQREKESRPEVTFIVISHDTDFIAKLSPDLEVQMVGGKVEQIEDSERKT